MLPPYGSEEIEAPNFRRLAERTVTFDNFYAGSMPCMPARRELHTGRYNFLHRINPYVFGSLLFDLEADPRQERPLDDPELELRMLRLLATQLRENDAPASQFQRLGIPATGEPGPEHLLVYAQRDRATAAAEPLPPLDDFAVGEFGIGTSVPELLSHPVSREVVTRHLPMLAQSELLGMLGSTTLYALAAVLAIPVAHLRAIADELAAI